MTLPSWLTGLDEHGGPYRPARGKWALYRSLVPGYMDRYILQMGNGGMIRIHRILREDHDRHLHDHPFGFTSYIVRGGYTEETERGVVRYTRGAVLRRAATHAHRLLHVEPNTWTLVVTGPLIRDWGFWTAEGWVAHRDYFARAKP